MVVEKGNRETWTNSSIVNSLMDVVLDVVFDVWTPCEAETVGRLSAD